MWSWVRSPFVATRIAFLDAQNLLNSFGPDAHREAMLRASDPLATEGPRSSRHWRRVAMIIGWRTGQDDYEDAAMPVMTSLGVSSPEARSGRSQSPAR